LNNQIVARIGAQSPHPMISIVAFIFALIIIGLILMQAVFVFSYVSFLSHGHTRLAENFKAIRGAVTKDLADNEINTEPKFAPKAAIILCLRGDDVSLIDCLSGIQSQSYPDFELHLTFDSEDDPAKKVVEDFFNRMEFQPKLHVFDARPNCSLKCSALTHVIERLDPSIRVVAFVDCDTIIDQDWLADLVNPLSGDSIGATTGNRWFSPEERIDRSFVQKIWNAAAVVQMYKYEIAWGGSFAMRRDVIDQCDLLNKWSRSFCEDTSLSIPFRRHGYRLHRVRDLVLDNNESANVSQTFEWMVRQLLTVKMHHKRWPEVLLHGVLTGLTFYVAPIVALLMLAFGFVVPGIAVLKACIVYQIFNFCMLWLIDQNNQEILVQRNAYNRVTGILKPTLSQFIGASFATQLLHPLAVLSALLTNRIKWRGVTYAIAGSRLKVLSVEPPEPIDEDDHDENSLPRVVPMHVG
jgi:cellulose synthase/poly-beta-1,6-N-acetylglucosamine synthase-like glycosyltransferase